MFEKIKSLISKDREDHTEKTQEQPINGYKPPIDFKKAIEEHENIKTLLEHAIESKGINEDTKHACNTNNCFLKEWLDNPKGSSLKKTQIFKDLIQVHNEYHQCIEDVISLIENQKVGRAQDIMNTRLKIALNKVRSYLMQLKLLHEKNYELKQILID